MIELTDVYYVARNANPETREVKNTLVHRRRTEWHQPDSMLLNVEHVLLLEPVAPGSTVATFIAEQRAARE